MNSYQNYVVVEERGTLVRDKGGEEIRDDKVGLVVVVD